MPVRSGTWSNLLHPPVLNRYGVFDWYSKMTQATQQGRTGSALSRLQVFGAGSFDVPFSGRWRSGECPDLTQPRSPDHSVSPSYFGTITSTRGLVSQSETQSIAKPGLGLRVWEQRQYMVVLDQHGPR